jgi:hypothetical protein
MAEENLSFNPPVLKDKKGNKLIGSDSNLRLLDCIDAGLGVFGSTVRQAVYWRLEVEYKMKREDIALRPEDFRKFLEAAFGIGTECVERTIIKEMKLVPGLEKVNDSDLVKAIKEARTYFHQI